MGGFWNWNVAVELQQHEAQCRLQYAPKKKGKTAHAFAARLLPVLEPASLKLTQVCVHYIANTAVIYTFMG